MLKKIIFLSMATIIFVTFNFGTISGMEDNVFESYSDVGEDYEWAEEAIKELSVQGVVSGVGENLFMPDALVTKEQIATMISKAFELTSDSQAQTYIDVEPERWSFGFVEGTKDIIVTAEYDELNKYDPERPLNRSEIAASCIKAMGLSEKSVYDKEILEKVFSDCSEIASSLYTLVAVAAERGIVKGDGGYLRPNDYVTRAEATVMIYRALLGKSGKGEAVTITKTPLIDKPQITAEQAAAWAEKRGAAEGFIEGAELYWKYGKLTGLNPEILYAQSAKETNFGKYTGSVKPEQNNWAGIKIYSPTGDKPEDHETFETPDDGVRAHFNHMCAYVGIDPIGEPHARYNIVKSLAWAGTVQYAEELGTKWAPDYTYGYSIVARFVNEMRK